MRRFWLFATALLLFGTAVAAHGAELDVDDIVKSFRTGAGAWIPHIIKIAMVIFWSLATLEFILCFGKLAIQGTDFSEVTIELFRRIIILSFGYFLLSDPFLFSRILQGFMDTAALSTGRTAGNAISGSEILDQAILLVKQIDTSIAKLDWYQVGAALMLALVSMLILWALATAATQMLLVMCEMYIVVSVGLLTLGLYSLEMTREYPMKFFGAIIGTGMKLFTLQLIIALGFQLVEGWTQSGATTLPSYMIMAGGALAFKEIAVKVPDYIQGLFSGSPGSGISAGGAVAAAGAVAGVAAAVVPGKGVVGAAMSISEAAKLGRAQGATGAGLVSATAKNWGKAALGVGKESAGSSVGGRMGAFNRAKAMEIAADKLGSKD